MKKILSLIIPFILLSLGVYLAYDEITANKKLPIYSPLMLNPDLVDESLRNKRGNHQIANFELFNQDGEVFNQEDLDQKIYVADFFFTTCPSICIDMSKQMMRLQEVFNDLDSFQLVSHTVQPEVDSVSVLKEYAELHGAKPGKWVFLTGDKKTIYDLARKSYFAATTEGDGGPDDFIHTENFVLVDKAKQIRGFYDGTSEEDVDRLIEDVEVLLNEYEK